MTTFRLQPPSSFRMLAADDAMLVLGGRASDHDLYCVTCQKPAAALDVRLGQTYADRWPNQALLYCAACGTAVADLRFGRWEWGLNAHLH